MTLFNNLNAANKPPEQAKGLGGNVGCKVLSYNIITVL